MTALSDFQVAMIVMGSILAIFGLAAFASVRRPVTAAVVAPIGTAPLTDRQTTDAIGADVSQMKTDLVKHDTRLGEVEHHLAQVRTMLGALPSKDAVNKLEVKITEVAGRVELTHEISVRNGRALERIENAIINRATL